MKVRVTTAGTALGARLTALCWSALTLIAPLAAVSACSGGSTSTPTVPTFTATVTGSGTAPASGASTPGSGSTTSPGSGSTTSAGTPGVATTSPAPHTATATATVTVTPAATPAESKIPSAAPVTGGGGTAGLQDGLLFAVGAAAIVAGAGSIVYRRRLTRHR